MTDNGRFYVEELRPVDGDEEYVVTLGERTFETTAALLDAGFVFELLRDGSLTLVKDDAADIFREVGDAVDACLAPALE